MRKKLHILSATLCVLLIAAYPVAGQTSQPSPCVIDNLREADFRKLLLKTTGLHLTILKCCVIKMVAEKRPYWNIKRDFVKNKIPETNQSAAVVGFSGLPADTQREAGGKAGI